MIDNFTKDESDLSQFLSYFDNSETSDVDMTKLFVRVISQDGSILPTNHLVLEAVKGKRRNLEIIKVFLNHGDGYDLNAVDAFGRTALFYANDVEVAIFLLGEGSKCNVKDRENHTPISYLISQGKLDIVRAIIGHIQEMDMGNKDQGCDKVGVQMNNALVSMQIKLGSVNAENIKHLLQDRSNIVNWNRAHIILLCADHSASFTSGMSLQLPPSEIPWSREVMKEHVVLFNELVGSLLLCEVEVYDRIMVEDRNALDENDEISGQVHQTPRLQVDLGAKRQDHVGKVEDVAGLEASESSGVCRDDNGNADQGLRANATLDFERNAIIGSAAVLSLGFMAFKYLRGVSDATQSCDLFVHQGNDQGFDGDLIAEAGITMLAIYTSYTLLAKARDRAVERLPEIEKKLTESRLPALYREWVEEMWREYKELDVEDSLAK